MHRLAYHAKATVMTKKVYKCQSLNMSGDGGFESKESTLQSWNVFAELIPVLKRLNFRNSFKRIERLRLAKL